jgi:hypothetical protein
MLTALYFFGGMADLFLSVMLWLIFDKESTPAVFVDGARVYAVTNIIRQVSSAINEDCA